MIVSCVAPARSSVPTIVPAVHHRDPVAHAEDLGQLGRDHHDRQPAPGQLDHQPVDRSSSTLLGL